MIEFKSVNDLRKIEMIIASSPKISGYVFLETGKVSKIIGEMYVSLTEDIRKLEEANKSDCVNKCVFDDLKTLEMNLDNGIALILSYRILRLNELNSIIYKLYEDIKALNQ